MLTKSSANSVEWSSYHRLNLSPASHIPSSLCPQLIMYYAHRSPAHYFPILSKLCPLLIMPSDHCISLLTVTLRSLVPTLPTFTMSLGTIFPEMEFLDINWTKRLESFALCQSQSLLLCSIH